MFTKIYAGPLFVAALIALFVVLFVQLNRVETVPAGTRGGVINPVQP